MNILTEMRERLDRLSACEELDVDAATLPSSALRLSDATVVDLLADVAAIVNGVGRVQAVLAGVAATRSARDRGMGGLAAVQGFASPESLIQSIGGGTKADAVRQVRVGKALLEDLGEATDAAGPGSVEGVDGDAGEGRGAGTGGEGLPGTSLPGLPGTSLPVRETVWHEPLRRALLEGRLTTAQHDAIRRGLGEPRVVAVPTAPDTATELGAAGGLGAAEDRAAAEDETAARDAMVREAWMLAAAGLADEAASIAPEELVKRARTVRDLLDPVGAEQRYARRFENRSYRMWVDADGQHRGSIAFDDEMAAFMQATLGAALRPRRGGPRFVSAEERAAAAELVADTRSNDQLAYDLFADIIRAGVFAEAKDVFGARRPGVRMVVVKDTVRPNAFQRVPAVGHVEDGGGALPGSVIDRNACTNGSIEVIVDQYGNPLDLGREARLYSAKQRLVLAARDGGCIWPNCDRPPSYCEAHHCDHYAQGGSTDVDRGVLLCRFHHMKLHNHQWRITRDGSGPFILHPPPGEGAPIPLASKAAWRWAWDPPPRPVRAGWRIPPDLPSQTSASREATAP